MEYNIIQGVINIEKKIELVKIKIKIMNEIKIILECHDICKNQNYKKN